MMNRYCFRNEEDLMSFCYKYMQYMPGEIGLGEGWIQIYKMLQYKKLRKIKNGPIRKSYTYIHDEGDYIECVVYIEAGKVHVGELRVYRYNTLYRDLEKDKDMIDEEKADLIYEHMMQNKEYY